MVWLILQPKNFCCQVQRPIKDFSRAADFQKMFQNFDNIFLSTKLI